MDTDANVDSSQVRVGIKSITLLFINLHYEQIFLISPFRAQDEEDYDVMQDPEFLQSVLENLPGVDPNNEAIRNAMGSLASQAGPKPDSKKEEEKKK